MNTLTTGLTSIPRASVAGILIREIGGATQALEYAERKARGSGPVARDYDDAARTLRAEVALQRAHAGILARQEAQKIVEKYASANDGKFSGWTGIASHEWEYATLTLQGLDLRVGASTGGVISVNGDPFTADNREMILSEDTLRKSIEPRLTRALATGHLARV